MVVVLKDIYASKLCSVVDPGYSGEHFLIVLPDSSVGIGDITTTNRSG